VAEEVICLRNDASTPLPVFTSSRPVPLPSWGDGVADEPMVRQFSSTLDSGNISNDSIIAYGNYKESHIFQFGALHISTNQCVDRSSLVQSGHEKTFMGVNWCKEVHCNLNNDGVELQREEKMKPQNKKILIGG
jgi:hypothetical protein